MPRTVESDILGRASVPAEWLRGAAVSKAFWDCILSDRPRSSMARTPAPRYLGSRVREIGEITAGLKRLARAEDVCVALLTQLTKAVEAKDRTDRRPNLADLAIPARSSRTPTRC